MKIGIDLNYFGNGKSGLDKYTYELLKYISLVDEKNTYYLYTNNELPSEFKNKKNFIKRPISKHISYLFLFSLKKQLIKDKIDLFYGPVHLLPRKSKKYKMVVTYHDLILIKRRETTNVGSFRYYILKHLFKRACKQADLILVNSKSTLNDVVECFHINPNKIKLIYNGYDNNSNSNFKEDNTVFKKHNIDAPYILSVGTIEPRKNILNSLKAFELYKKEAKSNIKYILIGPLGWKYEPILKLLNESEYKNDILYLNYVSNEEKNALYKNALYTSFISLYEGFGYPVIESLSYGTPVLTTNISSLPEVGGNVCYYVNNPQDVNEIKEKMKIIIEDINNKKIDKQKLYDQANKFKSTDTNSLVYSALIDLISKEKKDS